MNLKEIMNLWQNYQKWLKDNGINSQNIQSALPQYLEELKKDPEKLSQLQGFINSSEGKSILSGLNLDDNAVNSFNQMLGTNNTAPSMKPTNNTFQTKGNLTSDQLEMLKRFKR